MIRRRDGGPHRQDDHRAVCRTLPPEAGNSTVSRNTRRPCPAGDGRGRPRGSPGRRVFFRGSGVQSHGRRPRENGVDLRLTFVECPPRTPAGPDHDPERPGGPAAWSRRARVSWTQKEGARTARSGLPAARPCGRFEVYFKVMFAVAVTPSGEAGDTALYETTVTLSGGAPSGEITTWPAVSVAATGCPRDGTQAPLWRRRARRRAPARARLPRQTRRWLIGRCQATCRGRSGMDWPSPASWYLNVRARPQCRHLARGGGGRGFRPDRQE